MDRKEIKKVFILILIAIVLVVVLYFALQWDHQEQLIPQGGPKIKERIVSKC